MLEHTFFIPLAQMSAPGPTTAAAPSPGPATMAPTPAVNGTPAAVAPALTAPASMPVHMPETAMANLPAPADLTIAPQSSSELTLTWKDVATGETGYHVYRSTDGTFSLAPESLPKDATTFTDKGLAANTTYFYKVAAYNASGDGTAVVEKGATPSSSMFGGFGQILIIVVMFGALYLFLFRGQRKEEKKRKAMIKDLKKGDKVMTIGGMVARVVSIDGDEVVLKIDESANVKAAYRKSAIQEVLDRDDKK